MNLNTLVIQKVNELARDLFSKIQLIEQRLVDPKDVHEELCSWGPEICETLQRNHKILGITPAVVDAPAQPSSVASLESAHEEPAQGDAPSFPTASKRSARQRNQEKKAQSASRRAPEAEADAL